VTDPPVSVDGPEEVATALAALLDYAQEFGVYLGRKTTRKDARGARYAVGTFRPPDDDQWLVHWTKEGWKAERMPR
jgi:hypothetical protein